MSQSVLAAERRAPVNPFDWALVLVLGLLVGLAVASAKIDVLGYVAGLGLKQRVFGLGMLTIVAVAAAVQTRRWVRGPSADDFPIVLLVALAAVQLSGLKVGNLTATGSASIPLLIYWFSRKVLVPRERITLTPFAVILAGLATCSLWAWLWNGFFTPAFAAQVFVKMLTAVVIIDLIDTKDRLRTALFVFMATLALNSLAGVAQQVLSQGFDMHVSVASGAMSFRHGDLASSGLGKNRNIFGQTTALWMSITTFICFSRYGRGHRWWMVPLILLAGSQVYYCFSRGAWAALAVCLLVMPFIKRPAATPFLATGYGIVAALGLGTGLIQRTINQAVTFADHTLDSRFFLLQRGAEVFSNHLWHGVGIGSFARVDPAPSSNLPVHNGIFAAATDLGLPGVVFYIAMLGWVVVHSIFGLAKTRDPEIKVYLGALLVGAIGLLTILQVNAYAYSYLLFSSLAITEAAATLATDGERGKVPYEPTP